MAPGNSKKTDKNLMQVALHVGAHFTDDDKLLGSLGKNTGLLERHGVALPPPSSYRRQIRELLNVDKGSLPSPGARDKIIAAMLGDAKPDRIVLSNSNFFAVPRAAIREDRLYPQAEERLSYFAELMQPDQLEILLAIRDPATFLPAIVNGSPVETIEEATDGSVPMSLRWSELILRIREALPHVPVTVWCNEDTPLIWEEVMREMAGLDPIACLDGGNDLLRDIMSPEGLARFDAYLASHPGLTEVQKRRVIAAFLDKFALEDELEEELDLPGWTEDLVEALTEAYDEDVFQIERIPGVTLVTP